MHSRAARQTPSLHAPRTVRGIRHCREPPLLLRLVQCWKPQHSSAKSKPDALSVTAQTDLRVVSDLKQHGHAPKVHGYIFLVICLFLLCNLELLSCWLRTGNSQPYPETGNVLQALDCAARLSTTKSSRDTCSGQPATALARPVTARRKNPSQCTRLQPASENRCRTSQLQVRAPPLPLWSLHRFLVPLGDARDSYS